MNFYFWPLTQIVLSKILPRVEKDICRGLLLNIPLFMLSLFFVCVEFSWCLCWVSWLWKTGPSVLLCQCEQWFFEMFFINILCVCWSVFHLYGREKKNNNQPELEIYNYDFNSRIIRLLTIEDVLDGNITLNAIIINQNHPTCYCISVQSDVFWRHRPTSHNPPRSGALRMRDS
jgi:cbb3-type cytochrome oxidase subunit 3